MKEIISISIPKRPEYISVARMTTASIANTLKLNIDQIDDLKIIVSEIAIFFINTVKENTKNFEIDFKIDNDKFVIEFIDLNNGEIIEDKENLSLMIIESFSEDFSFDREKKKAIITKKI